MKRLLSLATLLMLAVISFAYDCCIDGIYYNVNNSTRTVTVTNGDEKYAGDINIPNSVFTGLVITSTAPGATSQKIYFSVVGIEEYAFKECYGLTSIKIPSTVKNIGEEAFASCGYWGLGVTSYFYGNVPTIASNAFKGAGNPKMYVYDEYKANFEEKIQLLQDCSFTLLSLPQIVDPVIIDGVKYYFNDGHYEVGNNSENGSGYDSGTSLSILSEISATESNREQNYPVTAISDRAFCGCSSITSATIPISITAIGNLAFSSCSGLTSITIPENVTTIGGNVFANCTSLTDVTLNSNSTVSSTSYSNTLVKIFGAQVKTYTIGEGVTTIGEYAFANCTGLTNITIPESVTTIGDHAFDGCSGLTSITIPESVTTIGSIAFSGCTCLTTVTLNSNYITSKNYNYRSSTLKNIFGKQVKTYIIGESVTTIGRDAFYGCTSLTNITIPKSVISIYTGAFSECTSLTTVNMNSNYIMSENYNSNISLKSIFGSQVTTYKIGESVTSINKYAFYGYESNTLKSIYIKRDSEVRLSLWGALAFCENNAKIYDIDTEALLPRPTITKKNSTQTSLILAISNYDESYSYEIYKSGYGESVGKENITFQELIPETEYSFTLYANNIYIGRFSTSTNGMELSINRTIRTASSLTLQGTYAKGDAVVKSTSITLDGKTVDGSIVTSPKGLKPYSSHEATYKVVIAYGSDNSLEKTYTKTSTFYTSALSLETSQPKVVSSGNVIIAATTNVDDEETNVGFEWRREDWSDTFASQTGAAVLYDGTMEGYIRNMNAEKLWKYRAYYLDNDGTYYYGDWVGIDPSNTSYFEPTVRTYANISVKGNTALVKGYALNGTDKIKVQGFKYWKTANKGNSLDIDREGDMLATAIPADAITKTVDIVGSGQQLMNATLEGLDYDATYHCVAFATTTENETFYGEEQMFTTESITGIEGVKESAAGSSKAVTVVAYYDLNGKQLSQPQKGLNILKMSDGTTRKVVK